jgi:hypothetical protein
VEKLRAGCGCWLLTGVACKRLGSFRSRSLGLWSLALRSCGSHEGGLLMLSSYTGLGGGGATVVGGWTHKGVATTSAGIHLPQRSALGLRSTATPPYLCRPPCSLFSCQLSSEYLVHDRRATRRLNQTGRKVPSTLAAASVSAPPACPAFRCVIQRPPCARSTRPLPTLL